MGVKRKLNPRGRGKGHCWVARLVADEDKENHENLPVERQSKCAELSFSLPKDRFSFFIDDKDLEEAMKTCIVGKKHGAKNSNGMSVPPRHVS